MTWCLLLWLHWVGLSLPASIHDDPQGRFHVFLPPGWFFAPQPGETHGAFFQRLEGDKAAFASISIMFLPAGSDLNAFATATLKAFRQEPLFKLIYQERRLQKGRYFIYRRYEIGVPSGQKLTKTVEEGLFLLPSLQPKSPVVGFLVHAETLKEGLAFFNDDLKSWTHTAVVPGPSPKHEVFQQPMSFARQLPQRLLLIGHWQGTRHQLFFSPNGQIVLDGVLGNYYAEEGVIKVNIAGETYVFRFDVQKNTLWLAGSIFNTGETYVREGKSPIEDMHTEDRIETDEISDD
jgi:hypothetical protein